MFSPQSKDVLLTGAEHTCKYKCPVFVSGSESDRWGRCGQPTDMCSVHL